MLKSTQGSVSPVSLEIPVYSFFPSEVTIINNALWSFQKCYLLSLNDNYECVYFLCIYLSVYLCPSICPSILPFQLELNSYGCKSLKILKFTLSWFSVLGPVTLLRDRLTCPLGCLPEIQS